MTDTTIPTTVSLQPLALPRCVTMAIARVLGLRHRTDGAVGSADEVFPSAIGATDRELARLTQRIDRSEVFRRQRTELWKRGGAQPNHI